MGSCSPALSGTRRKLLPSLLENIAEKTPDRVLFEIPAGSGKTETAGPYTSITAAKFCKAVDHLCYWMKQCFNPNTQGHVIGYAGPNDIRYFILILATCKTRNQLLLSSPRNSLDGHVSLARAAGCTAWFTTAEFDASAIIKRLSLATYAVPGVDDILSSCEEAPAHAYRESFDQDYHQVLVYLHSSGSTGLPKLIPVRLGTVACMDAFRNMDPVNGKLPNGVSWKGERLLCAMPLFHTSGLCLGFYGPICFEYTVVLPQAGPLSIVSVEQALDDSRPTAAFLPPSLLQDMSRDERMLGKLGRLNFITWAGGPLTEAVGHAINGRVPLVSTIGMTEVQWLATIQTEREDWEYLMFHPALGFRMEPSQGGGSAQTGFRQGEKKGKDEQLHELFLVRHDSDSPGGGHHPRHQHHDRGHPSLRDSTQPVFATFPELDRFATKDLYVAHPYKPHLWRFSARADDLVVLGNGEKFSPAEVEARIARHPWVRAAYVVGQGRFRPAVLLQPDDDGSGDDDGDDGDRATDKDIEDAVWPIIARCNARLPGFAQLDRSLVRVFRRPIPLTPKGTVSRHAVNQRLADVIQDMYEKYDGGGGAALYEGGNRVSNGVEEEGEDQDSPRRRPGTSTSAALDPSSPESLGLGILGVVRRSSGGKPGRLEDMALADDLLTALDSLGVVDLARAITRKIGRGLRVAPRDLYEARTVANLASALWARHQKQHQQQQPNGGGAAEEEKLPSTRGDDVGGHEVEAAAAAQIRDMRDMLSRHHHGESGDGDHRQRRRRRDEVLVTGTTGTIGPYLVDELVRCDHVGTVWCLNRRTGAEAVQAQMARDRGLSVWWAGGEEEGEEGEKKASDAKVMFLTGDVGLRGWGLDESTWERLKTRVTVVIHNAWSVNFNQPVLNFEPLISGLRGLVDFCATASTARASLCFISSVSVADNWSRSHAAAIPEGPIQDLALPRTGYGASKLLAEIMLRDAADREGFPLTVIRVGQVGGPVKEPEHDGIQPGARQWNRREWFPTLIETSRQIGALPSKLGRANSLDWVPVDILSTVICELLPYRYSRCKSRADSSRIKDFNVVNPRRRSWDGLVPLARSYLSHAQVISPTAWLERLQTAIDDNAGSNGTVSQTPIAGERLLDFYRDLMDSTVNHDDDAQGSELSSPGWSTSLAQSRSPTLRGLSQVTDSWLESWLVQWGYSSPEKNNNKNQRHLDVFRGWLSHGPESFDGKMQWGEFKPRPLDESDVDIEISHCGMSGWDLHILKSEWASHDHQPHVAGHEIVGHVVRVGSLVRDIRVGQRVGVGAQARSCLEDDCPECSSGAENYCGRARVLPTHSPRSFAGGDEASSSSSSPSSFSSIFSSHGGFATHVRARSRFVVPIPDGLSSTDAAPMLCGGVATYSALKRSGLCGPGKSVGIVGMGGLGHLGVQFAKALGADRVIAMSRREDKAQDALALGADRYVATEQDDDGAGCGDWVRDNRQSMDLVLCTVPSDKLSMEKYLVLVRAGGEFIQCGLPEEGGASSIDASILIRHRIRFGGSFIGSPSETRDMLQFAVEKGIRPWVQNWDMKDANSAVLAMRAGKARYRYVLEA